MADELKKSVTSSLQDSGYISTDLSHLHTSSISSSGYYSRLDSVDSAPWQTLFDPSEPTSIFHAIKSNQPERLVTILDQIPHQSCLDFTDEEGRSPLVLACLLGQEDMVRMLVVSGADINKGEGDGAVHVCARVGSASCLEALGRCVDVSEAKEGVTYQGVDWDNRNWEGYTPLHLSILFGHQHVTQLLLWMSAPTSTPDLKAGRSPLHVAVEKDDLDSLKLLLQYEKNYSLEDYGGRTPYDLARMNGQKEICRFLEAKDADVGGSYMSDGDSSDEMEE